MYGGVTGKAGDSLPMSIVLRRLMRSPPPPARRVPETVDFFSSGAKAYSQLTDDLHQLFANSIGMFFALASAGAVLIRTKEMEVRPP